jgi:hypothetical protein
MGQILNILVAIVAFVAIYTIGVKMMASFSRSQPPPPPSGELRKVRLTFQCQTCGTEVRMTKAPDTDPSGPSCCMQEMELIHNSDE